MKARLLLSRYVSGLTCGPYVYFTICMLEVTPIAFIHSHKLLSMHSSSLPDSEPMRLFSTSIICLQKRPTFQK